MRISTSMIYDLGVTSMQQRQTEMMHTQQQLATGRRVLTPADDPIAAARALDLTQSQSVNDQYQKNATSAQSNLNVQDSVLSNVSTLIQNAKTLIVNAGDASLTPSDLGAIVNNLQGDYQQLLSLANSTDGNGQYVFSGYQTSVRPFGEVAPGTVAYYGDQGTRLVQISSSRQIPTGDPGSAVFQRIKNGNGTFATTAAAGNAGTGVITPGSVVNGAALTGDNYAINFAVAGGATTYDVVDTTTGSTIVTAAPYTAGSAITFDGMQMEVSGNPANGDSFAVQPSSNVSLFKTLSDVITALKNATTGSSGNAAVTNALNTANQNLDNSLTNVLSVRASIGTRLKEIDTAQSTGQQMDVQYQTTLSNLQDVDYSQAASNLSLQQVNLQAAQQSFLKVTQLSLFNFLT
ncbi:MAG TPA: flagellar hook-associated protein FlgL [Burkholderiales bacterium]|nr:flagellar hook-associated protein FlgL [Burkholderiales bacterium]